MKRSLWASMVLAFVLCSPAAADDPKGDPPPPTCCPEGYAKQPTATSEDPKGGSVTVGVKTPVHLIYGGSVADGRTYYFKYVLDGTNEWEFGVSGGDDNDVCVKSTPPTSVLPPYGVNSHKYFSGTAPGVTLSGPRFLFCPPFPDTPPLKSYDLRAHSDEGSGQCNAGSENVLSGDAALNTYWPYKPGPQPTGTIDGKPVPRLFQRQSPTFGFNNQLLNKSPGVFRTFSATVHDYDDTESNLLSASATEQVLWDDPKTDDTPGPADVNWAGGGFTAVGNPADLEMPIGGTSSAVIWDVCIASLDDETSPLMGNDPPAANVDTVRWEVFRDHLARDIANEAVLKMHPKADPGNCHGAAQHAYDGSIWPAQTPPWGGNGAQGVTVFEAPDDPAQAVIKNLVNNYPFARGGVVVYNGGSHIQTCKGNGTGVWEYNGRCENPHNWGHSDITFTRDLLIDPYDPTNCSPSATDPNVVRFTTLIEYYPPPPNY